MSTMKDYKFIRILCGSMFLFVAGCLVGLFIQCHGQRASSKTEIFSPTLENSKPFASIHVRESGEIEWNGEILEAEMESFEMQNAVWKFANTHDNQPVVLVTADYDAPFGRVEAVFQFLPKLGAVGIKGNQAFSFEGEKSIPNSFLAISRNEIDWGNATTDVVSIVWPETPEWNDLSKKLPVSPEEAYRKVADFTETMCHADYYTDGPRVIIGNWYFCSSVMIRNMLCMVGWLVNGETGEILVIGDLEHPWAEDRRWTALGFAENATALSTAELKRLYKTE